jgi:hypothetical protein
MVRLVRWNILLKNQISRCQRTFYYIGYFKVIEKCKALCSRIWRRSTAKTKNLGSIDVNIYCKEPLPSSFKVIRVRCVSSYKGTTALSIMPFSMMTLSIMTLSIMTSSIVLSVVYEECRVLKFLCWVLPANIGLGRKGLPGTNTSSLWKSVSYGRKKFYRIGPCDLRMFVRNSWEFG